MFQFRRFPTYGYLIHHTLPCGGFPHSEISGSQLICSSPKLIAAYHVLHRLLMPRHSPCALLCLTFVGGSLRLLGSNFKSWSNKIGSLTFELCRLIWKTLLSIQRIVNYPNLLVDSTTLSSFTVAFSSYSLSTIQLSEF